MNGDDDDYQRRRRATTMIDGDSDDDCLDCDAYVSNECNCYEDDGFDEDEDMIKYSELNASNALPKNLANSIKWKVTSFSEKKFHNHGINPTGVLVTNPPFGLRIKLSENDKRISSYNMCSWIPH